MCYEDSETVCDILGVCVLLSYFRNEDSRLSLDSPKRVKNHRVEDKVQIISMAHNTLPNLTLNQHARFMSAVPDDLCPLHSRDGHCCFVTRAAWDLCYAVRSPAMASTSLLPTLLTSYYFLRRVCACSCSEMQLWCHLPAKRSLVSSRINHCLCLCQLERVARTSYTWLC